MCGIIKNMSAILPTRIYKNMCSFIFFLSKICLEGQARKKEIIYEILWEIKSVGRVPTYVIFIPYTR